MEKGYRTWNKKITIFEQNERIFKGSFKNSDYISKYGLYLPSGLATTPKDIKYVCKCINIITKKFDN